uniref:Uncharacterized protein n=1 Tax=Tanacetum cinerariifolium TaxID=118510 RepID=A0A699HFZ5_TANCI|nr:hypothetical protein [Tanacetum cinerariifolium]
MVTLQFADTHIMVAFLSKPTKNDGFEQIVDFLNAHPISGLVPTVSAIFTTASVVTPYSRRPREISAKDKDQRMNKQITRDAEIARIHAEKELKMMIDGLDRSNEMIAKHLHEYEQAAADLTIGEKIELINSRSSCKDTQLVPVEEVYVEALQVKHPIIDWEIHSEGKKDDWKIIRLGGHTAVYQFFVDMLKQFKREDLQQLWALVKETLSIRQASKDKEMELWVELKRIFEPDFKDQL